MDILLCDDAVDSVRVVFGCRTLKDVFPRLRPTRLIQHDGPSDWISGITGTPSREEDWTLDPLGNWSGYVQKTSGTTDMFPFLS